MKKENSTFFDILKSTAIFGSTQVFQMIIMLLRSKISAVLLGPIGMGMYTIFQTTVITISQISSCGIFQSGIKEISLYNNSESESELKTTVDLFSQLSLILSSVALLLMIVLSYPLSLFNFSNNDYLISFSLLGFGGMFFILSQKQLTILQATRQIKKIAIYSLASALVSLIISYIFYKSLGINGIILTIVLSFVAQYLLGYVLTRGFGTVRRYSLKEIFQKNKSLLTLGVVLMISGLLINVYTLFLNAIISKFGKIEDLGLFSAAFSITNGNILVLMSILSSDYYPRLASNVLNIDKTRLIVNQQSELMILITTPFAISLIAFSTLIVKILLSSEFLVIIPMLKLMSIGLLFRVLWQSMSYIILSKGDKKTYFIYDALCGNGFVFLCNILFYFAFGLEGLGYAFIISSVIVSILLIIVVKFKYKIEYERKFIFSFIICLTLSIGSLWFSIASYSSALISFLILSFFLSTYLILKRSDINLLQMIKLKLIK